MSNVLLVAAPGYFSKDLAEQFAHHVKDFNLLNPVDTAVPDIVIIDEDAAKLEELHRHYLKAPLFLLTSDPDHAPKNGAFTHIIAKPLRLEKLFNELRSSINLFENSAGGYLNFNRYEVRPVKKEIFNRRNGEVVKLTEKEVAILKYLYKAQDRIVAKNELLQEVWGYSPDVTTHTIETHVYRLRQKVEHDDPAAQLILTLDGGYQLKV